MRSIILKACVAACLLLPGLAHGGSLKEGFVAPPDSVRISCYWYWLSGNVTKEGVENDLKAMKRAGITRAFIGNMGIEDANIEQGLTLMSDEWFDVMRHAIRTAGELGIEIGVFNCPGWSQSGGPWIKPEQSMRYLATSAAEIDGGKTREISVAALMPQGAQPVKTLAFRVGGADVTLSAENATVEGDGLPGIAGVVGK